MPVYSVLRYHRCVFLWLCACAMLVAAMVLAGGYTRLSGSGLSITEWKPIYGAIPPLNAIEWNEEFEAYKTSPQYAAINKGMSVNEFKTIFWPEYWHRVLGRIVGLVFFVPFIFFALRKSFSRPIFWRLALIFSLGGLQGFLGWFMVKSGVMEGPYVSHIRLTMHLSMAFAIYAFIVWTILDLKPSPFEGEGWVGGTTAAHISLERTPHLNPPPQGGRKLYVLWFALLCLQIILGALVAGLHAGMIYNSYPLMGGQWIPPDLWSQEPWWHNLVLLQFLHRHIAFFIAVSFFIWWYLCRSYVKNNHLGKACFGVALTIAVQFALGVATLIHVVPLSLALAHQLTGLVLFTFAVVLLNRLVVSCKS